MKRSNLCQLLVLSAILSVTTISVAENKSRGGSFTGIRNNSAGQSSNNGGSFRSRIGQNGLNLQSGKGSNSNGSNSGNSTSTKSNSGFRRPQVDQLNQNNGHGNVGQGSGLANRFVDRQRIHQTPANKITLPPALTQQIGNAIQQNKPAPNRRPVLDAINHDNKHVPVDFNDFLHHNIHQNHGQQPHFQTQIHNIVAHAPQHLTNHPHFHWWVSICNHHYNTHAGTWNVDANYWNTWTPCNWHVVQVQQLSYFVGLTCIHIPDMQAYGVQSVIEGSPAHLAGLQKGDLIVSVNGQTVADPNLVDTEVARGRLDMVVIREGSSEAVSLTVIPQLVQTVGR